LTKRSNRAPTESNVGILGTRAAQKYGYQLVCTSA